MRKIICFLICLSVVISLSSCYKNNNEISNTDFSDIFTSGLYSKISADWPIYSDAKNLTDNADLVFIGKITDIDFEVLDTSNALPVSESTPEHRRELYTIYTVEAITVYKGDVANVSKIRVMGGMVDFAVDTQLEVMKAGKAFAREYGIPIWDDYTKTQCFEGESYLFALRQFDTGYPTILNTDQSIFSLNDPTRKQTVGNNTKIYYSGDMDEYNNPLISASDVIKTYGDDKLKEFTVNWSQGFFDNIDK